MDDKRLAEIRERAKRTWDVLVQTMKRTPPVIGTSIPARPDHDLDLLVGGLTDDVSALLAELARLKNERDLLARECGAWRKYHAAIVLEAGSFDIDGDWEADRKEAARLRGEAWAEWCDAKKANDAAGVKVEG